MPPLEISTKELKQWGAEWIVEERFDKKQGVNFARFIDEEFARALSVMLGGIPVVEGSSTALLPPEPDCVELGPVRVIGGIRPQNFDAAYRPDGPRVVFDSKTLNDLKSVGKNWQNMVNDLATEAGTVHTRFPYALVGFAVVIPRPALATKQEADIIRTLERLGARKDVLNQTHLAEAIAVIVWDPKSGTVDANTPPQDSTLRVERFSERFYPHYVNRYKGLPPHD